MKYDDLSLPQKILLAIHYLDREGDRALSLPNEDYDERMDICKGCEYCVEVMTPLEDLERYDGKKKIHGCQQCGCILEDKCKEMFQFCPIHKWDQNLNSWDDIVYPNMIKYFEENGIQYKEW